MFFVRYGCKENAHRSAGVNHYGLGGGDGRGLGVGVGLGVVVGVAVGVPEAVAVGVGVTLGVGVTVGVPVGVTVGVAVGVPLGVTLGVAVGVGVGVGVGATTVKLTVIGVPLLPVPPVELHGVAAKVWFPAEVGVHPKSKGVPESVFTTFPSLLNTTLFVVVVACAVTV